VGTFLTLAVSGLYIRFPFYPGLRPLNQQIHFIAMYVVVAFMLIRIVYALFKDGKQFILTKQDLQVMPQALMYYGFIRKQYPHIHKYNGMQKFTYGYVFPIGLTGMAITGFAMMWPYKLLGWAESVGTAVAYARVSHFMLAAILVMFVLIHICLSFVEDYPALMIFFGLHRQYWEEDYDEYYEDDEEFAPVTANGDAKNESGG
jgi:thiosulfate reductase cytochrome b subunit